MAAPNNNDVAACPADAYLSSSGGRDTYCTRCLVWRRQFTTSTVIRYFHCQICQTCVAHYDHHCDVFGRCIAGKVCSGTTGNIAYFYCLLVLAGSGYLTCLALILVALMHVWNKVPAWMVILVFVAGVAVLQYCCVPQCMRRGSASLPSFCVNGLVGLLFGKPTTATR